MSKGQYETYHLLTDQVGSIMAKAYASRGMKFKKPSNHLEALRTIYSRSPNLFGRMDTSVLRDEYEWLYGTERHVIFPANKDICTRLLDAKIDIQNSAPIVLPHHCFVLAMPRGFQYRGYTIPSLLIVRNDLKLCKEITKRFSNAVFGPKFNLELEGDMGEEGAFHVTYNGVDSSGNLMSYRGNYRVEDLPAIMRCNSVDEYKTVITDMRPTYASALDDDERQLQMYIMKLVCMMGIYANAYPDSLRSGYPTPKEPKHLEPRLHGRWTKTTLHMPSSEVSSDEGRNYHYRSWFFRQLTAERYYRGEHAHKPIGSRVVFVRDTMVGREIEAETLEE